MMFARLLNNTWLSALAALTLFTIAGILLYQHHQPCTSIACRLQEVGLPLFTDNPQDLFLHAGNWRHLPEAIDVPQEEAQYWPELMRHLSVSTARAVPFKRYYKTCAVVGNSGNLFDSGYGELIDGHDMVIRMTRANTGKRFQKDVGKKTDFWLVWWAFNAARNPDGFSPVFYPEGSAPPDYKRQYAMLAAALAMRWHEKDLLVGKKAGIVNRYGAHKLNRKNLQSALIIHYDILNGIAQQWIGRNAPGQFVGAGVISLALAAHMCEHISVFGFSRTDDPAFCYYHQLGDRCTRRSSGQYDEQEMMINRLEKIGMLTYYPGTKTHTHEKWKAEQKERKERKKEKKPK